MGTAIFDFLSESFLFDDANREDYYASVTDADLLNELVRYRQHVLTNLPTLHREIALPRNRLKVFGARDSFSLRQLKQSALYLDQVTLPDPLFPQSRQTSVTSDQVVRFLGVPNSREVDRRQLADAASRMKALTPMVAADYVKFFPVSYYFEPDEKIPLVYSETAFSEALPKHILSKYRQDADVKSLRRTARGLLVEDSLRRGRQISVQFGDDRDWEMGYSLLQNDEMDVDTADRVVSFRSTLPDEPPSVDLFQAWVDQSVNQAAMAHFEALVKELALSESLGASYLTSSGFKHSLLGATDREQSVQRDTAECILNIELPYFEDIAVDDLMEVRKNDGEAFRVFRTELERQLRELTTEADTEALRRKARNAAHELSVVQVAEIDQKIRRIRKGGMAGVTLAAGLLVATIVNSGWSIVATAPIVDWLYRLASQRRHVRDNPAYFLWKAKSRRRGRAR